MTLLCVVPFQKYIFCRGDFGSMIALPHTSSTEIKALPTFF